MAKYFRRRFRSTSASRFRRPFRRTYTRYRRPRPGTRRFLNRQRRNARPEIKRAQVSIALTNIPNAAPNTTINLMPVSWPQGDEWGQRQGRVVKTRKVVTTLRFTPVTPTETDIRPDNLVKFIIWSPRRNYEDIQVIMDSLGPSSIPAYTDVTVHKHGYIRVGVNSQILTNTFPSDQYREWVTMAPRTLEFGPSGSTVVDPNQIMYMTFINSSDITVRMAGTAYTYYIDP